MKIRDYIFLAKINLSRRKKSNILSIILISFSMLTLILSFSFSISLKDAMNQAILKNISYRTIAVRNLNGISMKKEAENKVQEIEHVAKIVQAPEYETFLSVLKIAEEKSSNSYITCLGSDFEIYPNIIKGRSFLENEKEVCIVPKKLYPYDLSKYDETKTIDGESLLGKDIVIEYSSYYYNGYIREIKDNYTKSLKVVGVYDNNENKERVNACYAPYDDLKEINEVILEGNNYSSNDSDSMFFVVVDSSANLNYVLDKIENLGYDKLVRSLPNTELVNLINLVSLVVSFFLFVLALIHITMVNIKSINERKSEIGILKSIGYTNKNMVCILLVESILIGMVSYVITVLSSILVTTLVQELVFEKNFELAQMGISPKISVYIIAAIVSILIPVISCVLCGKRLIKKSSMTLNKES